MANGKKTYAAFVGTDLVGRGDLEQVVRTVKEKHDPGQGEHVSIFDDATGYRIDIDFHGSLGEVIARLADHPIVQAEVKAGGRAKQEGPGRPRLGVVAREVTLLPRHWEWLNSQPGGASGALRRLVDEARHQGQAAAAARKAREAIHRFLWEMAGSLPRFEDTTRALDRGEYREVDDLSREWPDGVRDQLARMLGRLREFDRLAELVARVGE